MLGPIIGITTSIATIAATGLARGGAAVITGQGRRSMPVRRPRPSSHSSIQQLIAALNGERHRRVNAEAEVVELRRQLAIAGEVIDQMSHR